MDRRNVVKAVVHKRTNPMKSCYIFMGFFLFKVQADLGLSQTAQAIGQAICRGSMQLRSPQPKLEML